jgi:hypothetical protein
MRNWPEHVMTLCIAVIIVCAALMYYGMENSARCDDPDFAHKAENVQFCQELKANS